MRKTRETEQSQRERFESAARELGCDDSEERFVEMVRKIAKASPQRKAAKQETAKKDR